MNEQLLALLLQLANNGNQTNPLQQLLNSQQNQQTDLLSLLLGGNNQNSLQSLLRGAQQPQMDANMLTLLVSQLQNQQKPQEPQEPQLDPKLLEALKALGGQNSNTDGVDNLLKSLQKKADTTEEDDLRDAIKFNLEFGKFIEDYEDCFPSWFDPKEVVADAERYTKTDTEKAQILAAATVKAFFKNEDAIQLLEERDRNFVNENILKEGIKRTDIDRKLAWPMMQRAIHNKNTLAERGHGESIGGSDEQVLEAYSDRFRTGEKPETAGTYLKPDQSH